MAPMRYRIVYSFLLLVKNLSRCFYSYETQWVGKVPEDREFGRWDDVTFSGFAGNGFFNVKEV